MPIINDTDRAIAKMQSLQSLLDNPREHEAERRAGDDSLHTVDGWLSVENKRLRESRNSLLRLIAALVEEYGELTASELTLALLDPSPEVVIWEDKVERKLRVRTTKRQPPISDSATNG